jgi:peroxiredoxin
LGQLEAIYPQLRELGYRLIAISPDQPELLDQTVTKYGHSYQFLSDSQAKAAISFGLAFRVSDELVDKYKRQGIDIEAASGEKHHILPVTAVFIIGRDGVITYNYANPNYKQRMHPDVPLAAAKVAIHKA